MIYMCGYELVILCNSSSSFRYKPLVKNLVIVT